MIPGEDGELIQAGDEVPACGDVASNEDAKGEDGEGVHVRMRDVLPCEWRAAAIHPW